MSESFALIASGLASIARGFHARGWVIGTSGNLSAVVNREPLRLAMSPSGVDKGELSAEQILMIDERARVLSDHQARPSDESPLHIRIVQQRGAAAVFHTHSIWNTILSDLHAPDGGLAIEGYEMLKGLEGVRTHEHCFPFSARGTHRTVTSSLTNARMRGILLDIEGTTTPIAFVHEVLFPYARSRVRNYLGEHFASGKTLAVLRLLRDEHAADVNQNLCPPTLGPTDAEIDSFVAYVHWLIDRDRKSTGLKSLQGKIWKEGYLEGILKAPLFGDVSPALERWHGNGLRISIYSSGSVLAQRLLFAHTEAGDLSRFIDNYFDTNLGPKTEVESYRRIAAALSLPASEVLFISDVVTELDAG